MRLPMNLKLPSRSQIMADRCQTQYMCIYMYVYTYVYTYIYIYIYTCLSTDLSAHAWRTLLAIFTNSRAAARMRSRVGAGCCPELSFVVSCLFVFLLFFARAVLSSSLRRHAPPLDSICTDMHTHSQTHTKAHTRMDGWTAGWLDGSDCWVCSWMAEWLDGWMAVTAL